LSVNVGTLTAVLGLDNSGFTSGLAGSEKALGGFSKRMQAAEAGSYALLGGLAAVAAGVLAFGAYGVKSAASMEDLRMSFDVMLGSATKGQKLFKQLSDMANITPFDTEDLAKASKTLLGFGVSEKKVLPYLKMMGDISMGNKEKLQGLTLAFSQTQSAGRLMGQDLLQMINQGFNPLQYISKKTGESMGELKKRMEAGGISADEVAGAFKDATSKGGQFYKGMEKGSKTFSGLMSTVGDNVAKVARSLVGLDEQGNIIKGSFFDKLKGAAEGLGKVLTNFSTDVSKLGLGGALMKLFPPGMDTAIFIVAGAILGGLVPSLYAMAAGVWAAMAPLIPFLAAGAAIGGLAYIIYQNWSKIKPVLDNLGISFTSIRDAVINIVKPAIGEVSKTIDYLSTNTASKMSGFKAAFSTISQIVRTVIGTIKPIVLDIGRFIVQQFSKVTSWVRSNWPLIQNTIKTVMYAVKAVFDYVWPTISAVIKTVWNVIKGVVSTGVNTILGVIKTVMQLITGDWKGAWETIKKTAVDLFKGLIGVLGSLAGGLVDVGVNLVKGLWKGINSFDGWIKGKISGWITSVIDWAKKILGISSPSKVFEGIGKNIVLGLAAGISKNPFTTSPLAPFINKVHSDTITIENRLKRLREAFAKSPSIKNWQKLNSGLQAFKDSMSRVVDSIKAKITGLQDHLSSIFGKFNDLIGTALGRYKTPTEKKIAAEDRAKAMADFDKRIAEGDTSASAEKQRYLDEEKAQLERESFEYKKQLALAEIQHQQQLLADGKITKKQYQKAVNDNLSAIGLSTGDIGSLMSDVNTQFQGMDFTGTLSSLVTAIGDTTAKIKKLMSLEDKAEAKKPGKAPAKPGKPKKGKKKGKRATGGWVTTQGLYELAERGNEYVLSNPMVHGLKALFDDLGVSKPILSPAMAGGYSGASSSAKPINNYYTIEKPTYVFPNVRNERDAKGFLDNLSRIGQNTSLRRQVT